MCYSPAGLSGCVHRALDFHKQPDSKPNAQAMFKPALASCLLLSLWPKQVLKPLMFKGQETPTFTIGGVRKLYFISRSSILGKEKKVLIHHNTSQLLGKAKIQLDNLT